ncbi:MAG: hypothetical protein AAFO96_03680 [Bacteroidota bacterium]
MSELLPKGSLPKIVAKQIQGEFPFLEFAFRGYDQNLLPQFTLQEVGYDNFLQMIRSSSLAVLALSLEEFQEGYAVSNQNKAHTVYEWILSNLKQRLSEYFAKDFNLILVQTPKA